MPANYCPNQDIQDFWQGPFQTLKIGCRNSKYSKEERAMYEESLKHYRDLKNVVDTAFEKGEEKRKIEGRIERQIEIARQMKADVVSPEKILRYTGLSDKEIERL